MLTTRWLGLFPLGIVLLPGEVVPLHIFEERYKKLIGERLEEGEFGIVLAEDDTVRECGTAARVVELIEEMDDGTHERAGAGRPAVPHHRGPRARGRRRPTT